LGICFKRRSTSPLSIEGLGKIKLFIPKDAIKQSFIFYIEKAGISSSIIFDISVALL
jgi:hypothetical protein